MYSTDVISKLIKGLSYIHARSGRQHPVARAAAVWLRLLLRQLAKKNHFDPTDLMSTLPIYPSSAGSFALLEVLSSRLSLAKRFESISKMQETRVISSNSSRNVTLPQTSPCANVACLCSRGYGVRSILSIGFEIASFDSAFASAAAALGVKR